MENLKGKRITVLGLGKSGVAAARRLVTLGAEVTVSEYKPASEFAPSLFQEFQDLGVELEFGAHTSKCLEAADLIVVSPGVHLDLPALSEAKRKNIPAISEIELAYQLLSRPIIAVTGTNGKTTTTTLIGEMLSAADKSAAVAGNIGNPLVSVDDRNLDYIVAEISSYQLEAIQTFRPWISVILNIQEDHLERHRSMDEYVKQKSKIFANQTGDDYVVYNEDDPLVSAMVKKAKAKLVGFSKNHPEIITVAPNRIRIAGQHNLENSLAAAQAAYLCGVDTETVARVLREFSGVPHRIEYVRAVKEIEFYNDSKATNPQSTLVALKTFKGRRVILILGGRDKGVSLDALRQSIKEGVKAVVLLGEAAERLEKSLREIGYHSIQHSSSIEEAVKISFSAAAPKDIVLLSPACASFDMFSNFEERGRAFKEAVRNL